MTDTTTVKNLDSLIVVGNKNNHIILYHSKNKEFVKDWSESPFIVSILIPIIVASFVAWFAHKLNSKKNKFEIDKLKEETSNLKKTFQPIVIGTLQSIQDKIITSKIEALKLLVQIRTNFTYHEQQYCEGVPIVPDYHCYLNLLFHNFSSIKYNEFSKFHHGYSYLFPDNVFNILRDLYGKLYDLNETTKSFNSIGDPDLEASQKDRKDIEHIIESFNEAIQAIRKDCHLDTSFIHDFIKENKN